MRTAPARLGLAALLAAGLLTATAAPAPAEPKAAAGQTAKDKDGDATHGAAGGLPSFFPKSYDLGIYTLVVFGLMMLILARYAWPNIKQGLALREQTLAQARDEAVKARQDAEAIRAQLQAQLAEAQGQVRGMLEEARRDAEALRAAERAAGQKEAAAERDRAKREIDAAKDAALQEIYGRSVQLASLMSSKAIRRQLTVDDQDRLVEESLAELRAGVGR